MEIIDINLIEKFESESKNIYQERINFIKKVYNDKKNIKEAIRLSKIWMNFKYKGCRYSPEVYQKIKIYL